MVDAAVELAKGGWPRRRRRAAGASGLVNAVLRRAARERAALSLPLTDGSAVDAAMTHSVPGWLAEMWWEELGRTGRALLRAINDPAETALRVNPLRATPRGFRSALRGAGSRCARHRLWAARFAGRLVWAGPLGPAVRAALGDGRMVAQSRGSQAVVALLDPGRGSGSSTSAPGPG